MNRIYYSLLLLLLYFSTAVEGADCTPTSCGEGEICHTLLKQCICYVGNDLGPGCTAPLTCVNGTGCRCGGKECTDGLTCNNGECKCGNADCPQGEKCVSAVCKCGNAASCGASKFCESDQCKDGTATSTSTTTTTTTTDVAICQDAFDNCEELKDLCKNSPIESTMQTKCPQTCGNCDSTEPCTTPDTAHNCKDLKEFCENPGYKDFLQQVCACTCQ